jgi:pilus assembly protein Flp/PilA
MEVSKKLLKNLLKDESGQNLIEYAVVAGLVALGCITSMSSFSTKVRSAFNSIGTTLTANV